MKTIQIALLALMATLPSLAAGATPCPSVTDPYQLVPFRGHLEQNGKAYAGTVTLLFQIFRSATDPTSVYDERVTTQPSQDGDFTIVLGQSGSNPQVAACLAIADVLRTDAPTPYVGISVILTDPETGVETIVPLNGRQRLLAAPLATQAEHLVDGASVQLSQLTIQNKRAGSPSWNLSANAGLQMQQGTTTVAELGTGQLNVYGNVLATQQLMGNELNLLKLTETTRPTCYSGNDALMAITSWYALCICGRNSSGLYDWLKMSNGEHCNFDHS